MRRLVLCLILVLFVLDVRISKAAAPAATVISQAADFLFGEMQKRSERQQAEQINRQLAEISAKLDVISQQLTQALQALQQLQTRVEDIQDEQARKHVLGTAAQIVASYDAWKENPRKYDQIALQRLTVLQDNSRFLMANRSFQNFHMVGYAMLMEHDMFVLLSSERSLRSGSYKQYADYFLTCATDENAEHTVARLLKEATDRAAAIRNFVNDLPAQPLCPDFSRDSCDGDCRSCDFDQFTVTVRQPDGRFASSGQKRLLNKRNCRIDRSCGSDCGVRKPIQAVFRGNLHASLAFVSNPVTDMSDHSQCPAQLNEQLDALAALDARIAKLEEAKASCLKLEEQARRLLNEAASLRR
jgi:hypothetical protein